MMTNILLGYIFGALFYGFIVFMIWVSSSLDKKWLCTILIWPLALLVFFISTVIRGLGVLIEFIDLL